MLLELESCYVAHEVLKVEGLNSFPFLYACDMATAYAGCGYVGPPRECSAKVPKACMVDQHVPAPVHSF